jgi:RNA polymerase sigma-70 factor (ECF subfamily)
MVSATAIPDMAAATSDTLAARALGILVDTDSRRCEGMQPAAPAGGPSGICTETSTACLPGGLAQASPGLAGAESALPSDNGKNRALEAFFAERSENAFYVAYAALWHRETAMDVVQDSMLRLVEYYRDKPAGQWPALFRTILNSRINDVRRRRLLEQGKHKLVSLTGLFRKDRDDPSSREDYEIPAGSRDDGITAPEVEYVAAELRQKVSDALQSLSERQRQVFILREWRGMSIRETSEILGCSENSVKQHHFRAMRQLRKQLVEVWDHA